MRVSILVITLLIYQVGTTLAFVPTRCSSRTSTPLFGSSSEEQTTACSRRQAWQRTGRGLAAVALSVASPTYAKSDPLEIDKQKILAGYKRLNYLLDNWEKETTNCKTKTQYSSASNACERTPLNVPNLFGLSINRRSIVSCR